MFSVQATGPWSSTIPPTVDDVSEMLLHSAHCPHQQMKPCKWHVTCLPPTEEDAMSPAPASTRHPSEQLQDTSERYYLPTGLGMKWKSPSGANI